MVHFIHTSIDVEHDDACPVCTNTQAEDQAEGVQSLWIAHILTNGQLGHRIHVNCFGQFADRFTQCSFCSANIETVAGRAFNNALIRKNHEEEILDAVRMGHAFRARFLQASAWVSEECRWKATELAITGGRDTLAGLLLESPVSEECRTDLFILAATYRAKAAFERLLAMGPVTDDFRGLLIEHVIAGGGPTVHPGRIEMVARLLTNGPIAQPRRIAVVEAAERKGYSAITELLK